MIKAVLITVYLLSSVHGKNSGEVSPIVSRMLTHARISDFSSTQVEKLREILEDIKNPVVLYLMERRMLEGMFKRKAPQIILNRLDRLAQIYMWSLNVVPDCFSWQKDAHLQIALSFLAGGVLSGMRRDIFEVVCRSYKAHKIKEVIGFAGLVKTATLFSVKGYSPHESVELLKGLKMRSMSSIHFSIISELTWMGMRLGLPPDEAFSQARRIFRAFPASPATYRRNK